MPALTPIERRLKDQLDEANETIRQLRAPPSHPTWHFTGFTRSEACVLVHLSEGNRCSSDALRRRLDAVLPQPAEDRSIRALYTVIGRTRAKLARLDAKIEGRGSYWMSEASIAALLPLRFE